MKPRQIAPTLLAGCGGGSDNSDTAKSPPSSGSTSTSSSAGAADAVTISNFKFSPATITVVHGAKVTVADIPLQHPRFMHGTLVVQ